MRQGHDVLGCECTYFVSRSERNVLTLQTRSILKVYRAISLYHSELMVEILMSCCKALDVSFQR